jgi:hypothetical protein
MQPSPLLIVWIIWFALLSALGVYVGLAFTSAPTPATPPESSLPTLLATLAVVIGGTSVMLRPLLFGGLKSGRVELNSMAGGQKLLTGNIICFALSESVGIFGLVLAFQGYPQESWWVFFVAAAALMFIHLPLPARFQS